MPNYVYVAAQDDNQIAVFMEQGKELARRAAKMAGQDPKH